MSLDATATPKGRALAKVWDHEVKEKHLNLILSILAAAGFSYVFMCAKTIATGDQLYQYGDFFALWTSSVITHLGDAAVNYDPDALHVRQVALGMHENAYNPFPYPPTLLVLLGPLGGLSLGAAFCVFMIPSFALYVWAMLAGRARDWYWGVAAVIAPATGITLISGQTGFLSGALMLGGLRLAGSQPILSGVLFGLLTYKPQLGVLIPVALIAAGLWRTIAAACATVVVGVIASSLVYGAGLWPIWFHSITEYAGRFDLVYDYMPTIYANAEMLHAPRALAHVLQLCVSLPAGYMVWRAFRAGVTPQAIALLLVGTFLATPHAFNYDMPMMTAAIVWYLEHRYKATKSLDVGEVVALTLALVLPFAMLALKGSGVVLSFAPELMLFFLIARPQGAWAETARPLAA